MSSRVAFVAVLVLWSVAGRAAADGFSLRHRFVELLRAPGGNPAGAILVADLNGDGNADLVRTTPGRAVCELSSGDGRSLETYRDVTLDPQGLVRATGDVTGDGRPELFVVAVREGRAWLYCHDIRDAERADRPLWTAGPFLDSCRVMPKMGARGHVRVLSTLDADGDGRSEVYLDVQPYVPGGEPRKVVCLDGPTGKERWRFVLAPGATFLKLLTRRHGAERHLILETYAPSNGFAVGSETDSRAYLMALSPAGRREWAVALGGVFAGVCSDLGDLDGRGDTVIVASTIGTAAEIEADSSARPRLCVIDPASGRILRSASVPSGITPRLADLDGDGRDEIVGGGQDQAVYGYGPDLAPRWVCGRHPLRDVLAIADLDGDGAPEIVAAHQGAIGVLDGRGRLLLWQEFPDGPLNASPLRVRGRTRLLLESRDEIRLVSFARPDAPPVALATAGGVLALGMGGLGYVARRRRRGARLVERGEAQDRLLEAMMAFGHAGSSLGVIHRLQLHLRNWERVRQRPGARDALLPLLEDFVSRVLPDLVRLVALARRAQAKAQHWRTLAERALVVSAEVHELLAGDPADAAEHARRAEAELQEVDASLAGLRAHLKQIFRAPLGPAVRRALARREESLAAAGVEVGVRVEGSEEATGFVSPPQLDNVLDNLVDNALRAMEGAAPRRLTVTVGREGAYCRIELTDSGRGIAAADRERIFDRDYSTREGGGFGLYFARQVLARYEGKIFVPHGAPGEGATFRVLLRSA